MRQKRIVAVVNDDPYFLDAVQDVLRGAGYDVMGCKSSSEAQELVRNRLPDLIIIDVNLEHPAAGWSFLQLLRLDRVTADIPVIIATADVAFLRAKADHLRQIGCAVLENPFSIDALLREVTATAPASAPPDAPLLSGQAA